MKNREADLTAVKADEEKSASKGERNRLLRNHNKIKSGVLKNQNISFKCRFARRIGLELK